MEHRYGFGHTGAIFALAILGVGSLIGVLVAGRLADLLLARGHLRARVTIATISYFLFGIFFIPGLLAPSIYIGGIAFFIAAASLGAANPPLDAARLDIMHPHLWGRAEGVRMTVRLVASATAPIAFGFIAEHIFGGMHFGLQKTFLVMVIPLFVGACIAAISLRTYPRDVATAQAYTERTIEKEKKKNYLNSH